MKKLIHTFRLIHLRDCVENRALLVIALAAVLACGGWFLLVKTDCLSPRNALDLDVAIGKINTATLSIVSDHKTGPVEIQVSPELKPFVFVSDNSLESGSAVAGETHSIELTVAAAPDTKPGVYKGTLLLSGHDERHITLTVKDPYAVEYSVAATDGDGIANTRENHSSINHASSVPVNGGASESIIQAGSDDTPPGQADTADDTPPGQADKDDDTSPDQADTADDNLAITNADNPIPPDPDSLVLDDPLAVNHANRTPTRIMQGPDGNFYVSDALVDAVFVYSPDLKLVGEIKAPPRPLGVAVDAYGNVYIGSDTNNTVDLYDQSGVHIQTLVSGVQMPTDLALDDTGQLYVVDSLSDTVKVYDSDGVWLRDLGWTGDGPGQLKFPVAVAVNNDTSEIYVADQGHGLINVFDMQGTFLRSYGGRVSAFSGGPPAGKFVKLQSLAVDALGRLHALDSYFNSTQILDATTGEFLDSYGSYGTDVGKLNVPLDLWINSSGAVAVTNSGNRRVEYISTVSNE